MKKLRNAAAQAVRSPRYRSKVIPNKKKKEDFTNLSRQMREWELHPPGPEDIYMVSVATGNFQEFDTSRIYAGDAFCILQRHIDFYKVALGSYSPKEIVKLLQKIKKEVSLIDRNYISGDLEDED